LLCKYCSIENSKEKIKEVFKYLENIIVYRTDGITIIKGGVGSRRKNIKTINYKQPKRM